MPRLGTSPMGSRYPRWTRKMITPPTTAIVRIRKPKMTPRKSSVSASRCFSVRASYLFHRLVTKSPDRHDPQTSQPSKRFRSLAIWTVTVSPARIALIAPHISSISCIRVKILPGYEKKFEQEHELLLRQFLDLAVFVTV